MSAGSSVTIYTFSSQYGIEYSFAPERGGIITSLKFRGKEILYMDEGTLFDPTKNVKGGIPVLFPNAGPIEHPGFPGLKQHGFARDMAWSIESADESGFSETLTANEETYAVYPFKFRLRLTGRAWSDESFEISQEVSNAKEEKPMPVAIGLHPYFYVPADKRENVKFDFPGKEIIKKERDKWLNGIAVSIENPNSHGGGRSLRVFIPGLGRVLMITASPIYKRIWVWSQPGKDFICIEPVMRDVGGLVNDPELVGPGRTICASLRIRVG